jgi:hypothetical protein
MTALKVIQCKKCGRTHEIEVDVHAGNYAEAHELATIVWAANMSTNTKALAAVLVLRWMLVKYHAPADWLAPLAGLYNELADHAERSVSRGN